MKTVKAKVISSTPVRISKAASILSKFTSTENGASQAVGAYLRRTSEALNELTQLHKELKSSSSRSHRKKERSREPSHPGHVPETLSQEPNCTGEEAERKRDKKKSEEKEDVDAKIEKKKHKKKRKGRVYDGGFEENGFQNGKVGIGVKFETNEVEVKERKKRKIVQVEDGREIGSEPERSKKKKRKKSGDGDD